MPTLSPGIRSMVRHAFSAYGLDHLYDLRRDGAITGEDANGYVVRAASVTLTGLRCHYRDISSMNPEDTGLVVLERPILAVAGDDPANEGDTVLNVYAKDGTVIFAGPVLIENILDAAPGDGGTVSKVLSLRTERELPR